MRLDLTMAITFAQSLTEFAFGQIRVEVPGARTKKMGLNPLESFRPTLASFVLLTSQPD